MPEKPKIIKPSQYQEVKAHDRLNLEWEKADYAYQYIAYIYNLEKNYKPSIISDSTAIAFYAFFFADPDVYTFKILASDKNYYDYIRSGSNDAIVHLEGGLGVFGAIAYDQVQFIAY